MVNYENRRVNILKGLFVVFLYFMVSLYSTVPLSLLHISYANMPTLAKEFYNLCIEIVLILVIFFVFMEQYIKAFDDLKKNHWGYFSKYFKYYLLGVILMMASNVVINLLGGGLSGNEEAIRSQFQLAPIYTFVSSVFLAPILEESVFRLGFRNVFKNNVIFIILSGLIFGGLHLINGIALEFLPLYLVSYCSVGFAFAYILTKCNNIFVSVGLHTMHNGILMSLQVAMLLFG